MAPGQLYQILSTSVISQRINIYDDKTNMFTDASGAVRPLARRGDTPVIFYKAFSDMEHVMGRGGQLYSFEAVFSPKDGNGQPRQLWDRSTGKLDQETARYWERYDIRLQLEKDLGHPGTEAQR